MFDLGLLGTILVWLGIGVAALAGVYGLDYSRQKVGVEKQRAEDQPILSECATTLNAPKPADCAKALRTMVKEREVAEEASKTAINANKTLQDDLVTLAAERKACSDEVDKLARQTARMRGYTAARKPQEQEKFAEIDLEKAELVAALGLPDKPGTCEQKLARSEALWKKIAERRQRDFPRTPGQPAQDESNVIIKVPAK